MNLLTKKSLRNIIGKILKQLQISQLRTVKFLDDMKNLVINAFKGGLSFNLDDIIIPAEKKP
jgi:DNA-directed RNA polymerase subunit beta'